MRYFMLNKPGGCITARCDERHSVVMDLFPKEISEGLFPVGRLDRDTEGFLLVTDDGNLCFKLMSPSSDVEKKYFFWATGTLDSDKISALERGVKITDKGDLISAPAKLRLISTDVLYSIRHLLVGKDAKMNGRRSEIPVVCAELTITEGKKHQVKRMLKAVGCKVVYLKRIAIAGVELDPSLPLGAYRPLTESEIEKLCSSCVKANAVAEAEK